MSRLCDARTLRGSRNVNFLIGGGSGAAGGREEHLQEDSADDESDEKIRQNNVQTKMRLKAKKNNCAD